MSASQQTSKNNGARGSVTQSLANTAKKIMGSENELTFDQLKRIEQRRRAILQRKDLKFYQILSFWDGTCLQVLALDPLMWFTMLIYIAIRIQSRLGLPDYVSDLAGGDIGVIGAFLSFFLVFFVVNANTRFNTLYGYSMGCKGNILNVASISKVTMPKTHAQRLVRYLNAAHIAGYVGLSETYTYNNFFKKLNQSNLFLTKEEYTRICEIDMNAGGSSYRELITWCMQEVQDALEEEIIGLRTAVQLRDYILKLQASMSALFNFADQPISFFYLHFICLLSALYLPLFAVSLSFEAGTGDDVYWTADLVNGLIVFLQAVFVIGLRILGQKMMDPYGDDVEDLSVMHYVNFTWLMSNRILLSKKAPPRDPQLEERICRERKPLGDAWEDDNKLSLIGDDDDEEEEEPIVDESAGRCIVQ